MAEFYEKIVFINVSKQMPYISPAFLLLTVGKQSITVGNFWLELKRFDIERASNQCFMVFLNKNTRVI